MKIQLFQKKVVIVNSRYWNQKGTLCTGIMSDNALVKVVTCIAVALYDNLHSIIFCKFI